ncbi:TRAFAC clade GTPase domain-containing protein [Lignipirellula cremea]|uniref:Double-GTPase 2 domain-containing protein n=1 Tax=Lignipirellula cremea TaxID=2528010 RepID=A0A518DNA0_9BACT|nr:hypothetical protein [Lignipirellula cremea]QDU93315.1 hypothetical protein Pla8534_10950 [Lignipirellula cremea]
MTREGMWELQSYKLADYSVSHPCFICHGGNNFDAELCRHCMAPMALAHQAAQLKTPPRLIAAVGSAGAGKTVYLGMLTDMLSRENNDLQVLARGAFSVQIQQITMEALANCRFPDKTPSEPDHWNWLHSQIQSKRIKRPYELMMPDLAGDALLEEINHPNSYPVIHHFLSKASGIMLLVDAAELEQGSQVQDFFATKIVSYLCELESHAKTGWPNRPIAVILSKADQCDTCFLDPLEFARKYAPSLWRQVKERLKKYQFFATGVAGACATIYGLGGQEQIPLRVEPRGIVEPFSWLTHQISKKP